LIHPSRVFTAAHGDVRESDGEQAGAHPGAALAVRRGFGLATKRMGLGAFQEASLTTSQGDVRVFSAIESLLVVDITSRCRHADVDAACRDLVAIADGPLGDADA